MLLFLVAVQIGLITATETACNVVVINGKNFERQVLKAHIDQAYQLTLDPQTNTLFFSYTPVIDEKTVQKIGYLNVDTNEFGEIPGVNGAMATGVDTTKHIVYFGGNDGIYTYDYATKTAKNIGVTTYGIWQMFYCPVHGLFFTTSDDDKPFIYKDDQVQPFTDLGKSKTRLIAVGEHHSIYFANSTGTYIYDHHKGPSSVFDLGDYTPNSFTRDSTGKLYFTNGFGFFSVKEKDRKMTRLLSVSLDDTIWGGAFDKNDNIIYSNDENIFRLVPTDKSC